jgi:hypothetical protein
MSCLSKNKLFLYFFALLLPLLNSCKAFDPEEQVPSYIHIDHFDLTTDPVTQGSNSAKITDAWVYVDEQLIGAFELPCTVPVLASGSHTVKIRGGIKKNGISATRVQYPFYNFYTTTATLIPGNTVTLQPTVSYYSGTTFEWLENFENTGTTINAGPYTTDTTVVQESSDVFEGAKSGGLYLPFAQSVFYISSASSYYLPQGEQRAWLELNYKSTHQFTVGVLTNHNSLASYEALTVNPSETWNKIYIDLSPEVSAHTGPYYIFFAMASADANNQVLLDNIKLVH